MRNCRTSIWLPLHGSNSRIQRVYLFFLLYFRSEATKIRRCVASYNAKGKENEGYESDGGSGNEEQTTKGVAESRTE